MTLDSIMPKPSRKMTYLAQYIFFVLALFAFSSGVAHAQRGGGALERLAGHWGGSGTIDLTNGTHERLRCRASYDLLAERHSVELNIRCASDSYNFDLFGKVILSGHSVSGSWSESTRSVAGTLSGTADGDRIQVHAVSAGFSANLALTTRGDHQSVLIRTPDPSAGIKGATINLRRSR